MQSVQFLGGSLAYPAGRELNKRPGPRQQSRYHSYAIDSQAYYQTQRRWNRALSQSDLVPEAGDLVFLCLVDGTVCLPSGDRRFKTDLDLSERRRTINVRGQSATCVTCYTATMKEKNGFVCVGVIENPVPLENENKTGIKLYEVLVNGITSIRNGSESVHVGQKLYLKFNKDARTHRQMPFDETGRHKRMKLPKSVIEITTSHTDHFLGVAYAEAGPYELIAKVWICPFLDRFPISNPQTYLSQRNSEGGGGGGDKNNPLESESDTVPPIVDTASSEISMRLDAFRVMMELEMKAVTDMAEPLEGDMTEFAINGDMKKDEVEDDAKVALIKQNFILPTAFQPVFDHLKKEIHAAIKFIDPDSVGAYYNKLGTCLDEIVKLVPHIRIYRDKNWFATYKIASIVIHNVMAIFANNAVGILSMERGSNIDTGFVREELVQLKDYYHGWRKQYISEILIASCRSLGFAGLSFIKDEVHFTSGGTVVLAPYSSEIIKFAIFMDKCSSKFIVAQNDGKFFGSESEAYEYAGDDAGGPKAKLFTEFIRAAGLDKLACQVYYNSARVAQTIDSHDRYIDFYRHLYAFACTLFIVAMNKNVPDENRDWSMGIIDYIRPKLSTDIINALGNDNPLPEENTAPYEIFWTEVLGYTLKMDNNEEANDKLKEFFEDRKKKE